jgi:hypothetical protein
MFLPQFTFGDEDEAPPELSMQYEHGDDSSEEDEDDEFSKMPSSAVVTAPLAGNSSPANPVSPRPSQSPTAGGGGAAAAAAGKKPISPALLKLRSAARAVQWTVSPRRGYVYNFDPMTVEVRTNI